MPPNRKRAAPRPRATRTAPYEQIASIEAPTNNPAAPTPAAASTVPTRPLGLTSVSMVMSPFLAPAASSSTASNQPEREMNEHEEAQLVQPAVGWASSRKMSLPLFYADLATSYNRYRTWYFDGHSILPAHAERKLQELEAKWQNEPAFRKSYSDSAQAMEVWMRDTRDVEIKEKAKQDKIVKKAEEDREWKLGCEADKERMYQEFLGNASPRRGPIEVPSDDDVLDETSEDESTDLDVTTADDSSDEDTELEERLARLRDMQRRHAAKKPVNSSKGKQKSRHSVDHGNADDDFEHQLAAEARQDKLDRLVQMMLQDHKEDQEARKEKLRADKEHEKQMATLASQRKQHSEAATKLDQLKVKLLAQIEEARKSDVEKIVAYVTEVTEVMERQVAVEEDSLEKLATVKSLTLKHAKLPVTLPSMEALRGVLAPGGNLRDIVPLVVGDGADRDSVL